MILTTLALALLLTRFIGFGEAVVGTAVFVVYEALGMSWIIDTRGTNGRSFYSALDAMTPPVAYLIWLLWPLLAILVWLDRRPR